MLKRSFKLTQKYRSLAAMVRKIDPETANYMIYEAPLLPSFQPVEFLSHAFSWFEAKWGFDYWHIIARKLREMEE